MRAPKVILEFVRWRWAPTIALALGAVSYVVLAVALIPDQIGGAPRSDGGSLLTNPARGNAFATRISLPADESPPPAADVTPPRPVIESSLAVQSPGSDAARRGFSPPLPRPEPPPPPAIPEPPPVAVPPPPVEIAPPPPSPPAPDPVPTMDVMAPPVPTNMPAPDAPTGNVPPNDSAGLVPPDPGSGAAPNAPMTEPAQPPVDNPP